MIVSGYIPGATTPFVKYGSTKEPTLERSVDFIGLRPGGRRTVS